MSTLMIPYHLYLQKDKSSFETRRSCQELLEAHPLTEDILIQFQEDLAKSQETNTTDTVWKRGLKAARISFILAKRRVQSRFKCQISNDFSIEEQLNHHHNRKVIGRNSRSGRHSL